MKFYPMHMHLHASHEPTASIGSHMAHAAALGIHHIWITEHDVRMGRKNKYREIPIFRFPKKELFTTMPNGVRAGFKRLDESSGRSEFVDTDGGIALNISAMPGECERLLFSSRGKNHCDPLFSGVSVKLDADINAPSGSGLALEFILSAQPPSFDHSRLVYFIGDIPDKDSEGVSLIPFPNKGEDGKYTFPISTDVTEAVGGLDNCICYICVSLYSSTSQAAMCFKAFEFLRELDFEPVRQNQIKVAEAVGKKWGVTPFVTYEISDAGHHKNCYTTSVPVLNYEEHDHNISQEYAIAHVKKHGGIFCYNHPFTEWKREERTKAERAEVVKALVVEMTKTRVYGATLMEVGFPYEKESFYTEDYLALWDGLSENGVFITGDGDSDNHHATADGWMEGNNFATFAGIYDHEEPDEKSITDAFKRGSVWCGNPVVISDLSFSANGAPMGSIFVGVSPDAAFKARNIKCSGYAVLVVNGDPLQRKSIEDGCVAFDFKIPCEKRFNFARVAIYDENGILIALSNPIYTVKDESDIYEEALARKVN